MNDKIQELRADAVRAYEAVVATGHRHHVPHLETRNDVHTALAFLPAARYADGSPHPVETARVALARLLVAMVDERTLWNWRKLQELMPLATAKEPTGSL